MRKLAVTAALCSGAIAGRLARSWRDWMAKGCGLTVVCGGEGVWGVAWMTGLLKGWADLGLDIRFASAFIGTSAGLIVSAQMTGSMSTKAARAFDEAAAVAGELINAAQRTSIQTGAQAGNAARLMIWWGGAYPDLERLTRAGDGTMNGFLGIALADIGPDWLRASMPVTPRTHQPFGRLHGGASVTLAETVGSIAGCLVVDPALFAVVGMEINANHIRPAFGGLVYATATAEALGRTIQIWSIRIENEAGKLICLSRFTAAVIAIERK